MCVYIRRTGRLPAAPAAQHNPQQQPHTQTARMACCRAGPALSTQPQQRAHERRVSGVSIRLGMRAAPAVRQWPAGRLVKAPQQPLQAVGRRGGGGVCVRGKRGGCERSTHYLREQSVSHHLREQSAHYLRRPPCGGSWRDAWRRRGSNRSGQRGGAGGCVGGGVCARWGGSACGRSAASKGSQWRGFGRARAALTLAAQSPVATGRVPCPRNPVLEAARVSSAPVRVFLQTSEIP